MPPSKNISFDELSKYFHLPINQVAKELGVCATILKKLCRKNGIPRWPHRKIKSLDKMISNLNSNLDKNPNERDDIAREIDLLKNKKLEIMKHPDILVQKPNGVDSRQFTPKMKQPKIHNARVSPYGAIRVKDALEEKPEQPLNCFAPIPTYPVMERKPEEPKYIEPVKPIAITAPETTSTYQPQQQQQQSPQLPRPMSLNALNFSSPPPGFAHNFYVPPANISSMNEYSFPSLKLPEIDPKRFVLPSLEQINGNSQQSSSVPSSPLPFRPTLPTPQTNKPLFPDWFNQERERIFGQKN